MLVPHESSRSETESTENLIFFGRGNYLRKFRELQQTMRRNNKRSLFVALPFASFDFHNSRLSSRREKRWRWHFLEPSEKRICSELYLAQSDFCLYLTATNGLFDLLLFANENRTNSSEFEIKQDMAMECLYSISFPISQKIIDTCSIPYRLLPKKISRTNCVQLRVITLYIS